MGKKSLKRKSEKLLTRKQIEERIGAKGSWSWQYWAFQVCRIQSVKTRVRKGRAYFLYTVRSARKLEEVLRRRRPDLFRQPEPCLDAGTAAA